VWRDVLLRGDVVVLRSLRPDDADALARAANEDRSTYGFTWVPRTVEEFALHNSVLLAESEMSRAVPLTVELVADGRVVGQTRFLDLDWLVDHHTSSGNPTGEPPKAVEIGGTWYAASVQRTSVNTEAKLLLLTHAFEQWGVERVSFKTDARNLRSRRAIERIGARFEGIRRAHMRASDGSVRDSAYFSIISSEWPNIREKLSAMLSDRSGRT
jgi:RimJ/RimL family protein N-acetyltransferase